MTERNLPRPVPNADSLPYWNAARENRLVLQRCSACGAVHFLPRSICPVCWSSSLAWVESKGAGVIQTYTIVHRAPSAVFAAHAPYFLVLVDLDEGVRMFANLLGDDAHKVAIGDRVRVVFEDRGEGCKVPQFSRATEDPTS